MRNFCVCVANLVLAVNVFGCVNHDNSKNAETTTTNRAQSTISEDGPVTPAGPTIRPLIGAETESIPLDAKYVSVIGDDSWPGTESRPWRNILPSLQKLSPGDTLVIRGGTYTATGNSEPCGNGVSPFGLVGQRGTGQAWITIMGYPGERPKLYHPDGWQTLYICDSAYVRIRHLEVFGDANTGNTSPANGVYIVGSHHVLVEDVWAHDNGGCGICTTDSNHITIQANRVWGNSHWNPYHSSGISLYSASNAGGGNALDGYSNRIVGNLVWGNWEDDSLGEGQQWGVTDGNGIIIDRNRESRAHGRTLVEGNVLTNNGGPGVMVTESHAVDIVYNTLYHNVRTRVPTVKNNGEIGCNGGRDVKVENNIVVPHGDNENLFQSWGCEEVSHANNIWVRSGAPRHGSGDVQLPNGTRVLRNPQIIAPTGNWTPVGEAIGRGAQ